MNRYPPGTNRQTFKEIQRMPPIKLSEWLLTYGDYWLNEGAHAQWDICKEALHRLYGFGPSRLERLEDEMNQIINERRNTNAD